jgi:L-seryl-tRNA(Ser) seleniumtransferase
MTQNLLRQLPAVDTLLKHPIAADLLQDYGREATIAALRHTLHRTRDHLRAQQPVDLTPDSLLEHTSRDLQHTFQPSLRPVINATGIIIHTNLGRAPLSQAAQRAIQQAAADYTTLEYNLETGQRGSRLRHAADLLVELTGAEAALVVNNNAAALVLILAAFAQGREVIISRGQLVEIGGGFRVPEVMQQSGARLVEVGTTNRTRAQDFQRALTPQTALLIRAHSSNFKQIGFVEETPLSEMAAVAHAQGALLVDDLGSGALLDTAAYGLEHEPTVQESLAAGCDLVAFSADKLLGGPQAGIIIGRKALIDQLQQHPLARAIRADKLCLAGLAATLDHYRRGNALQQIPIWRMIAYPLAELHRIAAAWAEQLGGTVIPGQSAVGGGSLPGETLPTVLVALRHPNPDALVRQLRLGTTPIIARIVEDQVVLDPRTVLPGQEFTLLEGVHHALQHTT